ncbi:putative Rhodanese-like domain-containing protein [Helianthus annuus]|nr:putative Rhodanese-like domain-containing protein [Helianthus annuus]
MLYHVYKFGSNIISGYMKDFREKDGIPDLRRKARFRYASVSFPEVDANVKKLLKGGKDLDDALVSTVIRNLKVVQGGSKVIVMDADGSRSKGIARALRKFGIKRPYLVQGGFRSWVQEGLRIKEPKPETTLTILNEEAEAILEDVTPLQVIGYGVGFLAAAYALLEWETTLQLIAIFGVGQTIYKRVASYEDSKDFNRDVRQLLAPVKLGGQAISWAAGKLETNRNGLPTSPSSVNVQNRVLQAAAKHESQPDSEEPTSSVNQTPPDLSEA